MAKPSLLHRGNVTPHLVSEDRSSPHFDSDKDIWPGDLVRASGDGGTTLWQTQRGQGIVGKLRPDAVGLVIVRDRQCDNDLGDQLLVLTGDRLGWNTTHSFEKIQDDE